MNLGGPNTLVSKGDIREYKGASIGLECQLGKTPVG